MSNNFNIIREGSDSYKVSHWKQFPKNTEKVHLYLESRGGGDSVLFFGLQYIISQYLSGVVVTREKIDDAKKLYQMHFGTNDIFNEEGWEYILAEHNGMLPIEIKSVKEGSLVSTKNVLLTVENTDPKCYWLPGWIETILLQVWYPTTVATKSYQMKKIILDYLIKSGDPNLIDFKLHDFGYRGSTTVESSAIGGAAHLVNFKGSDTLSAITLLSDYYQEECAGFSIPAAEHSTITSWGKDKEKEAYANMLEQFPGMVAVVSDSYDIWNAIGKIWGDDLKEKVLNHEGTLVIRPDSGYPPDIVIKCLDLLGEKFGFTINKKGYKVLVDKVRLIQGDGISKEMIEQIQTKLDEHKWSGDNIAYGCGGALLQKMNRDTFKFAIKCSSIIVNGVERDVFKDPITDPGKKSKKGRMSLHYDSSAKKWQTKCGNEIDESSNMLETVFKNGVLTRSQKLDEIRQLSSSFI